MSRYENDMICDLAETYQIFDYRRVPGRLLGTLVAGLGPNSRVYQKLAEQEVPTDTFLLTAIVDELRMIVYLLDGNKNKKAPDPIAGRLIKQQEKPRKHVSFRTPEEFLKARADLIGEKNGN